MGALRLLPHRRAAGRRGWVLGTVWRTGLRPLLRTSRPFFGFHVVAALPAGTGSGVNPRPTSTSTPQKKPFLRHGAEGLHLAPAPTPLHWLRPARAAINPGSLTQRLMAAAVAAAMMWGRQTGKSQRGGSVSGGKSARRGVRVTVMLNRTKTPSEKAVASIG
ncbi:hypothetical protein OI450_15685 [Pectobacterium cacticida]|uniref:Uncharacterized protein n=1 Tax=Pectobacterium cacticida TaxID=69221 RepID=A0ABZ2GBQ3_9GAMM|nr:hypothetical protein [Pectobacterium cacticida]UYX06341.1 hypothetical protein OI450_15685 [Pectobacterium cacticida]